MPAKILAGGVIVEGSRFNPCLLGYRAGEDLGEPLPVKGDNAGLGGPVTWLRLGQLHN